MSASDKLVSDYLKRVERATRGLPATRRRELMTSSEPISSRRLGSGGERGGDTERACGDRASGPGARSSSER